VLPAPYEFLMKFPLDMVYLTVGSSIVSHNDMWRNINRSCYFSKARKTSKMFVSLKYLLSRLRFLNIPSYVIEYNGLANFFRDWPESILGFAGQEDVVK
jgi:hypothetical protein